LISSRKTIGDIRSNLSVQFRAALRVQRTLHTEAENRIANLDVAPGLTAARRVLPGNAGPFNGIFPASLVRPDRNNFAPRIGIAWKPQKQNGVRTGYGINYNLANMAL